MFFIAIIYLFVTSGFNFSVRASHKATVLIPICTIHCLVSQLSFLESSGSLGMQLAVLLCVEISCSSNEQNTLPRSKQLTSFSPYSLRLLRFTNPEAWFLFLTTSRWFAVRLDAICAIFVTVIAFGSLILAESKYRCE